MAKLVVANTELLLYEVFGKKASLKAKLHTELAQLVQWMSQIESKQVKQDDIVWSLQEQLEGIKSALVQEDEDMGVLNRIQAILENTRSKLKDLKLMSWLFYSFTLCRLLSFVVTFFCAHFHYFK